VELFLSVTLTVDPDVGKTLQIVKTTLSETAGLTADRLSVGFFLTTENPCETLPLIAVDNGRPGTVRLVLPLRNSAPLYLVPGLTGLEDISFHDFFHLFHSNIPLGCNQA
jgi:hypothetical protein